MCHHIYISKYMGLYHPYTGLSLARRLFVCVHVRWQAFYNMCTSQSNTLMGRGMNNMMMINHFCYYTFYMILLNTKCDNSVIIINKMNQVHVVLWWITQLPAMTNNNAAMVVVVVLVMDGNLFSIIYQSDSE